MKIVTWSRRRSAPLVLSAAILAAACGSSAGLSPSVSVGGYSAAPGKSGIRGIVGAAPACSAANPPCRAPSYLVSGAEVSLTRESGEVAATTKTGPTGGFTIDALAGTYYIQVTGGSPPQGRPAPRCPAKNPVEVKAGSYAQIRIGCVYGG